MSKALAALLFVGCIKDPPLQVAVTHPLKVEPIQVVVELSDALLDCWLEDPPEPPSELAWKSEDDDVFRRAFVRIGQYNDQIVWMKAMRSWAQDLKVCIEKITQ